MSEIDSFENYRSINLSSVTQRLAAFVIATATKEKSLYMIIQLYESLIL